MRTRLIRLVLGLVLVPAVQAPAQRTDEAHARPVVVELFTSQSCASCPPADTFLTELARTRRDVLPLAFHVTYWNNLGWQDLFSFPAATARQRAYAAQLGDHTVYTPQMVVDGAWSFVGSDRTAAETAIRQARAAQVEGAPLHLDRQGQDLTIEVGMGTGPATILLVGFDPEHSTAIGRGENSGRRLLESNIVRSIQSVGQWSGEPLRLVQPVPAGEQFAVLLAASDGRIIGAARLT
ncbi:MAG: DUF1223 domain-containing protein [Rhodopila sp.]|jgi:hypothetical protein